MSAIIAVAQRRLHRRDTAGPLCITCGEAHPCRAWRLARAEVLVMVRAAFAAARTGRPW